MNQEEHVPYAIAILITPYFNAMATCSFIDPFRAANYLSNKRLYEWHWCSGMGGVVQASNGMTVASTTPDEVFDGVPDMGVISSSWTPERHYSDRILIRCLRSWANRGAVLCGLDTGSLIMAHAGVLDGRSATVHYEHIDTLTEMYPDVRCSEELFVADGRYLSTAGGVASADLALHVIQEHHGKALANDSARYIFHERLRTEGERQSNPNYEPAGQTPPQKLRDAILILEKNLEQPLTTREIARHVGLGQRQLVRLFRQYTGCTVVQYYRDIRLDRARSLVTQTDMSVSEISIACGFGSVSYFSKAYRARFGVTAYKDRVRGRIPFQFRAWPMHSKD